MAEIYSVTALTSLIKANLEQGFPFLWVKGQISNLARPGSGHVYFSLKDENALLSVVWFKARQGRGGGGFDPLTGEVFDLELSGGAGLAASLENGQEILCGGRVTVYAPRGQYQLIAETVQDVGLGRLHLEFEALKRRYMEKGYFDQERKRPIPRNPQRVAVVSAPGSAAVRDFLRLASERGLGGAIRIHPTLVQGDEAPAQIARAMDEVNGQAWAEAVVLIRGGGSLEDLWAYNTEPVAEAVFNSRMPVVAGIGHEVDISIADMIADVRAATPSHAAQLLFEERETLEQMLDRGETALTRAWARKFQEAAGLLEHFARALAWFSPAQRLERATERFAGLAERLERARIWLLRDKEGRLDELEKRLLRSFGPDRLQERSLQLDVLENGLRKAAELVVERGSTSLDKMLLMLEALDPKRPLRRGYAIVRERESGRWLRSVRNVNPGDVLDIGLADGEIGAEVRDARPLKDMRKPLDE